MNKVHETNSPGETHELGMDLADSLCPGHCIALCGNLGAGKTTLVRGITEGLGGDVNLVSSPTYVLVQEYPLPDPAGCFIFHIDLFRMGAPEAELSDLGIDEMLENGIVVIEWAERAGTALPRPRLEISIEATGPESRCFVCRAID